MTNPPPATPPATGVTGRKRVGGSINPLGFLPKSINDAFAQIRERHGATAIERVEAMLHPRQQARHPMQAKAKWIMPGLSTTPWRDPHEHAALAPLVNALESNHAAIKAEYEQTWQARAGGMDNYNHYLVKDAAFWKALYLYKDGALVSDTAAQTPFIYNLVDQYAVQTGVICPLLESHFSTLMPGGVIPPHCDLWNFSLNLHFAIDIPSTTECAITVAGEARPWQEGKCLYFDYSYEHEAYNRSDRRRTCLLMDVWNPEVSLPEREALVVLVTEMRSLLGTL